MPVSTTPKSITINEQKVLLYYINHLATALGRSSQTVRKWEIAGIIPKTMFKDREGRRMYTQEQVDLIVKVAEDCGIKQGGSIAHSNFSPKVHKALEELNKKYKSK